MHQILHFVKGPHIQQFSVSFYIHIFKTALQGLAHTLEHTHTHMHIVCMCEVLKSRLEDVYIKWYEKMFVCVVSSQCLYVWARKLCCHTCILYMCDVQHRNHNTVKSTVAFVYRNSSSSWLAEYFLEDYKLVVVGLVGSWANWKHVIPVPIPLHGEDNLGYLISSAHTHKRCERFLCSASDPVISYSQKVLRGSQ